MRKLTAAQKMILRESFVEAFGENGSEKRKAAVEEVCNAIGKTLQQERKMHKGETWLWTLGKPVRPLRADEVFRDSKLI